MASNMWNWLRREPAAPPPSVLAAPDPPAAPPRAHVKAGPYRPLHDYLRKRFADSVVLTFGQIEDLLGAPLPAAAYADEGWWGRTTVVAADAQCSDAWVLAKRSARVNLPARTVVFDRIG
jgi:hypothetical protein